MTGVDVFKEGARQFSICNACRYCEGFCPVWPVMERRRQFEKSDLYYLANICHDCKACYYACPYTEPNEQKINIPQVLSELRLKSYKEYAKPKFFSGYFENHKRYVLASGLLSILAVTIVALVLGNPERLVTPQLALGSFYVIFPYMVIIGAGLIIGIVVISNYVYNIVRFYREIGGSKVKPRAIFGAAMDVFLHDGFKGGWHIKEKKAGCYHEDKTASYDFLTLHALIFYGFIFALVSTVAAGIYQDILGILPPYPIMSVPVLFGTVGGILIIAGSVTFLILERRSDFRAIFKGMNTLDYAFLLTLTVVSITGFLTLVFRSTSLLGSIFTIHLGFVLLLFVTAPYGKFVHFTYRYVALVFTRVEEIDKRA